MTKLIWISLILWSSVFTAFSAFGAQNTDPLKIVPTVKPDHLEPGQTAEIKFALELPPGFHAYQEQFIVEIKDPANFPVGKLSLSPTKTWYDKFSKKERSGMEGKAELNAAIEAPAHLENDVTKLSVRFTYQACTDAYCLLPTDKVIEVPIFVKGTATQKSFIESVKNVSVALKPDQKVTWITFLLTFLAGVLTSLTPCVFPMIPITLGVLRNTMEKGSKTQLLGRALIYIAGMSVTYSSLGVIAAASGNVFGSLLGQTWFLVLICVFLLIMSMSLFDLFEVQIPAGLQTFAQSMDTHSAKGVLLAGLFSGLLAAPCVAPVLVGILSLVATQKSYFTGFALLLAYAWGLGIILLLITVSTGFLHHLPRAGQWMEKLKYVLGILVLAAFYYYLHLLLPENAWTLSVGIGFILLPFLLKFIPARKDGLKRPPIILGLSIVMIVFGSAVIFKSVQTILTPAPVRSEEKASTSDAEKLWQPYSDEAFAKALASGKPTLLDFYADWCAACHELTEQTFIDAKVQAATSEMNLFRFDGTNSTPLFDRLKEKYKIVGLPTVLMFDRAGKQKEELSLFEFETPDKFLIRIEKLKTSQ